MLEPQHETIIPFTRYLAGPGDFTPTVLAAERELLGNTWPHELAQAIVFTSPFLCAGGHPKDYLINPAKDLLCAIPAVWDETRVLNGSEPGKVAAFARRSGDQWFVGVLNGGEPSTLDIPCDFLGSGVWKSTMLSDAPDKNADLILKEGTASASERVRLELRPRGGFVARFRR